MEANVFTTIAKYDINHILDDFDDGSDEYKIKKSRYNDLLHVCNAIDDLDIQHENDIEFILNALRSIWECRLIEPLTLKDNEFFDFVEDKAINKRYIGIYKDRNGNVYNNKAFYTKVIGVLHTDKEPTIFEEPHINEIQNTKIYFVYNGGIPGWYIEECAIPKHIVDKGSFPVKGAIPVPCYSFFDDINNETYYISPLNPNWLRELRKTYNVKLIVDKEVQSRKIKLIL